MNKKIKFTISMLVVICIALTIYVGIDKDVLAYDFASNESYYASVCKGYISDTETRDMCEEYRVYLQNKINNAINSADKIQSEINGIQNDLDALSAKSKDYKTQINNLEANISEVQSAINTLDANIAKLDVEIDKKIVNIEKRKELIRERMIEQQVRVNTNQYIDFIMGATDLADLIQRSSSLKRFTEYDNELIDLLHEDMEALENDKKEQNRMKETQELQKQNLQADLNQVELLNNANLQLMAIYESKKGDLLAQKNAAQSAADTAIENMPSYIFGDGGNVPEIGDNGFLDPIPGSYRSAGTWYYPASFGGGLHLGLDRAASIGTPIKAPANAVVLYANNPAPTNGGYLGNWVGTPFGGGNTVSLLMNVNGVTYAMNFYHMSQNMPVKANGWTTLTKGQVFGYVGNSGNTSGPHCHIEVLRLNLSVTEAVAYWNSHRDWMWGTSWNAPADSSSIATKIQPESIFGWN